jgi:hypothetical protein
MIHNTPQRRLKGDDDGCFSHALWAVRSFGGVLEHPEASHAWPWHGLKKPPYNGGWVKADNFRGWSCCVSQGYYGHPGQKMTWLYAVDTKRPELKWGKAPGKQLFEEGFKTPADRARLIKYGPCARLSKKARAATPKEFKELLISMLN